MEFLENKTREITAGAHLLSVVEIKNGVPQIEAGALLIVSNYILGLIWGNDLAKKAIYESSLQSQCLGSHYTSTKKMMLARWKRGLSAKERNCEDPEKKKTSS